MNNGYSFSLEFSLLAETEKFPVLSLMAFHFIRHLFSCLSFRLFCLLLRHLKLLKSRSLMHTHQMYTHCMSVQRKNKFSAKKIHIFNFPSISSHRVREENHKMLLNLWHFVCTAIKFILFSISTFSFRIIETSLHSSTPRVVSCLPKVNFSLFLRKYLDINIFFISSDFTIPPSIAK